MKSFYLFGCGIFIPPAGTELGPVAVNASSPNHWTVREFLTMSLQSQTWCPGDKGRKEGKRKEEEREEGRRGSFKGMAA